MKIKDDILVFFLLTVVGLLFYWDTLSIFFLSDDFKILDLLYKDKGDIRFTQGGLVFRPIAILLIKWLHAGFGLDTSAYHLLMLFFHVCTSFFIYKIVLALFPFLNVSVAKPTRLALLASFAFLLYPFHLEGVIWIACRGTIWAACLGTLSFYFYCKKKDHFGYLVASWFSFFLALLGYESVWTLPLVIFLFEAYRFLHKEETWQKVSITMLGYCLLFIVYFILRTYTLIEKTGGTGVYFLEKVFSIVWLKNGILTLARALVPPQESSIVFVGSAAIVSLCLLALLLYVYKTKEKKLFSSLLLLLLATGAAMLPIVHLGVDTHDSEGSRFLYFPSVFGMISCVFLLYLSFSGRNSRIMVFAVLFLYFTILLEKNQADWIDAGKISEQVVKQTSAIKGCDKIFIVNLPEQLNGAYIFRQKNYHVQDVFYPDLPRVKILSKYPISDIQHEYSLEQKNDSTWVGSHGTVQLQYLKGTEEWHIQNKQQNLINRFETRVAVNQACIYYFSKGNLMLWQKSK